jgi:molecular chaperone GrpE
MSDPKDPNMTDPEATVVMQDVPGGQVRDAGAALENALTAAEGKAEESRADYLRALAELENMRRRTQRDIENAHRYGLEKFAQELLGVRDSLELGLEAAGKAGGDLQALVAGTEATLQLLSRGFEKFNINEINPIGEPFDPKFHEAIAMRPSATAEPNSVLTVIQKGYRLNDRLLRPARVIVSQAAGS